MAPAGAQQDTVFACVNAPAEPSIGVVVPGFPGQRLYLHPKHPDLCPDDGADCASSTYVVTGDPLAVTQRCGSWAFASYKAAKKVSTGWVAFARLPEGYENVDSASHFHAGYPAVDPNIPASDPVCREARDLLDGALLEEKWVERELPTAVANERNVPELPKGVGPEDRVWSTRIGDVLINGKPLKVASYSAGGTCHASYVEIWNNDFSQRLPIGGDTTGDGEMPNYTSQILVKLQGKPFFAQLSRGAREVQLWGFDEKFEPIGACRLTMGAPPRESIVAAAEPEVCEAVLSGKVSGAPVDDVEPFSLASEALVSKQPLYETGAGNTLVGRGNFDVDNDGTVDDVGIVQYDEYSGAGCGHRFRAQWPVKLNTDGMPDTRAAFNEEARKIAGSVNESRLFIFRGVTYYERRSHFAADGTPNHAVWKLTTGAPVQTCKFKAVTYGFSR